MKTWRESGLIYAQRIIDQKQHGAWTEPELKKALSEGYPWGERSMHPYKIWLSLSKDILAKMFPARPEDEQHDFGLFLMIDKEEEQT